MFGSLRSLLALVPQMQHSLLKASMATARASSFRGMVMNLLSWAFERTDWPFFVSSKRDFFGFLFLSFLACPRPQFVRMTSAADGWRTARKCPQFVRTPL